MSIHLSPQYVNQRFGKTLSPWGYELAKNHIIYDLDGAFLLKVFAPSSEAILEPRLREKLADVKPKRKGSDMSVAEYEAAFILANYHANVSHFLRLNGIATPMPAAVLDPYQTGDLFTSRLFSSSKRLLRQVTQPKPPYRQFSIIEEKFPSRSKIPHGTQNVGQYMEDVDYIRSLGFEPRAINLMYGQNAHYVSSTKDPSVGFVAYVDLQDWEPITDFTRSFAHTPYDLNNPAFSKPVNPHEASVRNAHIRDVLMSHSRD